MELWQALFLGLVEGLTEYLPVSSTGHLLLAERALGVAAGETANAYAICIQAGAVAAVFGLYFKRVVQMLRGLRGSDADGRRLSISVLIAFFPAAVAGILFDKPIERLLFGMWYVVGAWFVGGVAILVVAYKRRGLLPPGGFAIERLTARGAFAIGLCQCLALWPGTSRSLVTIVGGVLVGMNLAAALEFSFLLGLLTLFAATAYKGVSHGPSMLADFGWGNVIVGFTAAFASAWISVRWMVGYLQRRGLELFGYWRIAIALVVACLLLAGRLVPV
jgi:undecaprenyl-diphosphatase